MEYCAKSELLPRSGLEMLSGRDVYRPNPGLEALGYAVEPFHGILSSRLMAVSG
jgi:hypothetical protein